MRPDEILSLVSKFGFESPTMLLYIIPIAILLAYYTGRDGFDKKRTSFLVGRILIIFLIVMAIASPHLTRSREIKQEMPPITILVDRSESMDLFSTENFSGVLFNDINAILNSLGESADVNLEFFTGNRTAIGDALYRTRVMATKTNNIIVLVSDGQNNQGREPVSVANVISETNTTIFTISPPEINQDIWISRITGSDKTPVNSEYDLNIVVEKTSKDDVIYEIELLVDNREIYTERVRQKEEMRYINKTMEFSSIGIHEVVAKINPISDDYFKGNNVFYKTVEIVEKPSVLVITRNQSSPLLSVLSRVYDVSQTRDPDANIMPFTGVFLDNVNAGQLDRNTVERYKQYVLDGNGLVVVGGDDSFEYGNYNNSYFETLLPVKSGEKPTKERKEMGVVFLIDLSCSFASSVPGDTEPDEVAKALLINLLRQLDPKDSIGVVAFNVDPYTVIPFQPLGNLDRMEVEERIMKLQACLLGKAGTDIYSSLDLAADMLSDYENQKTVFVFTDGEVSSRHSFDQIYYQLDGINRRGLHVSFVGIGGGASVLGSNPDNPNPAVQDRMIEMASRGGGQYYGPSEREHERLRLKFGEKEDEDEVGYKLKIYGPYHFITDGLYLDDVKVKDFNKAYEKSIARVLVSTKGEQPILTVWWFGLGRVAALTTDNGNLWGTGIYSSDGGKLVSALTNWVIGDLEKGKDVLVKTADTSIDNDVIIKISSESRPNIIVKHLETNDMPKVSLKQENVREYTGILQPENYGFYAIKAYTEEHSDTAAVAVNFPTELNYIGLDPTGLSRIAGATGGGYYNPDDIKKMEKDMLEYARKVSTARVVEKIDLWMYFAALAMVLFFADVVRRRVRELMRLTET